MEPLGGAALNLASPDQCASVLPVTIAWIEQEQANMLTLIEVVKDLPPSPHDVSRSEGEPPSILEYLDRHSRWRSVSTCMVAVRMTVDLACWIYLP
jgi:hypothetical protein